MAGVLLSRARPHQCRHVVLDSAPSRRGEPADIFAGRRVCGAAVVRPGSYCAVHRLLYYRPAGEIAPPRDASRRAAPPPERIPELTEIFG